MNKILLKIACAFVISISNIISAAESGKPENLHALCARQDKHQHALDLLQAEQCSVRINDPDADGRTPLHIAAPFVWAPDSSPPDHYGQGNVQQWAETTRRLVQLLIRQGATNASDTKGKDCIAIAGSAWSAYTPLQSTTSPPDQGVLNTQTWLQSELEQTPKRILETIQSSWPESPKVIAKLIVSFVR